MKLASKILHIVTGALGVIVLLLLGLSILVSIGYSLFGIGLIVFAILFNHQFISLETFYGALYIILGICTLISTLGKMFICLLVILFAFLGLKNNKALNIINIVLGVFVLPWNLLLSLLSIVSGVIGLIRGKKAKVKIDEPCIEK